MKEFPLKYATKCHACGKRMSVGAMAYGQKNTAGKWIFECPSCYDDAIIGVEEGAAPKAIKKYTVDSLDIPSSLERLVKVIKLGDSASGDTELSLEDMKDVAEALGLPLDEVAVGEFEEISVEPEKKERRSMVERPKPKEREKSWLEQMKEQAVWRLA